jgi:hypothetical protein
LPKQHLPAPALRIFLIDKNRNLDRKFICPSFNELRCIRITDD